MISVDEARAMVEEFEAQERVEIEKQITEFVETVCNEQITRCAKQGMSCTSTDVPKELERGKELILEVLRKNGFQCSIRVYVAFSTVFISWRKEA